MKYYSEDDVMDLIREAEDCERAYEWGEGHRRIHFEDYHSIEIPDKHGRLIVADALLEKLAKIALPDDLTYTIAYGILKQIVEDAPTIVEANNE